MSDLTQAWPRPSHPLPVAIIGAGAIVRTAHLPVYRRLGFPVAGVYDVTLTATNDNDQDTLVRTDYVVATAPTNLRSKKFRVKH